ncbi:hypothetical protein KIN20_003335 [Parelaphostrongylus tenuis]|uniref:Uncharacterized protein n=1 Tax=Parelaphostrongylus tenuis TaxID=148309 RepID=A0AAD5MPS6_PARTN|nr:hypothetical protein KIN20_003335 [Parelaphostrongylus tenuis]
MARYPTGPLMISLLATIPTVLGCGVLPSGQTNTRILTVTDFTLLVAMVYTGKPAVSAQFTGIANSEAAVRGFVQRLVIQTQHSDGNLHCSNWTKYGEVFGSAEGRSKSVSPTALTIGGTLSTTNIIMANWSRAMWQSVVNRALRMLALGPFGQNFLSASAVVGGN